MCLVWGHFPPKQRIIPLNQRCRKYSVVPYLAFWGSCLLLLCSHDPKCAFIHPSLVFGWSHQPEVKEPSNHSSLQWQCAWTLIEQSAHLSILVSQHIVQSYTWLCHHCQGAGCQDIKVIGERLVLTTRQIFQLKGCTTRGCKHRSTEPEPYPPSFLPSWDFKEKLCLIWWQLHNARTVKPSIDIQKFD